jgi:hypothetical protein
MDTAQIDCLLKCALRDSDATFLGVFAADHLPKRIRTYPSCYVANIDPHDRAGQHWVACFLPSPNKLEFFDSYGLPPESYAELQLARLPQTDVNPECLQSLYSTACGHYCIYFLCARAYGAATFTETCSAPLRLHPCIRDRRIRKFVSVLRTNLRVCMPCRRLCGSVQCCRAKSSRQ